MTTQAMIDVALAYPVEASQRGKRKRSTVILATTAPVLVPQVAASEAPVAIVAEWRMGAVPPSMTWRSHGGALWRPLVAPAGTAMSEIGGFEATVRRHARSPGRLAWADYPFFATDATGTRRTLPFGQPGDAEGMRIHSDGLEEARRRAQAVAADGLLLVDGVMHMRSVAPAWAVGRTHSGPWSYPGHVRLVMPDHDAHADRLVTFPLDRFEDACAFAESYAAHVGRQEAYLRLTGGVPPELIVQAADTHHADMAFPDTVADDLANNLDAIRGTLGPEGLVRFGLHMRGAFEALSALARSSAAGGVDWKAEVSEHLAAFVTGVEPGWPNGSSAVERLRGLLFRDRFEAGLGFGDDAEALAGLAL